MTALFKLDAIADGQDTGLFEHIAQQLTIKGYSINPFALPADLTGAMYQQVCTMEKAQFSAAGIGRTTEHTRNSFIRRDEICWITGDSVAGQRWLNWASELQSYLNRRLFLGLFSFESHFAIYGENDFYKRHVDAFKGQANRVLSLVVYLNPHWNTEDGGELVLYENDSDMEGIRILPGFGTIVAFLSEEFPHEVLPARRNRYSIAGWFRVNTSSQEKVDPPR